VFCVSWLNICDKHATEPGLYHGRYQWCKCYFNTNPFGSSFYVRLQAKKAGHNVRVMGPLEWSNLVTESSSFQPNQKLDSTFLPEYKSKTSPWKLRIRFFCDMTLSLGEWNRWCSISYTTDHYENLKSRNLERYFLLKNLEARYFCVRVCGGRGGDETRIGAYGYEILCTPWRNVITVDCWQVICTDILQFRSWILCNLPSPTVRGIIYSYGQNRRRLPNGGP